jgi:hypothetical protein
MINSLKTCVFRKPHTAMAVLILALLATILPLIGSEEPAVAQAPGGTLDSDLMTYASANGQSTIVSRRTVLETDDFALVGLADNIQSLPDGLTLAENTAAGVFLFDPIRSPLDFTTDIGPAWLADIPEGASVTVEARLSDDGHAWDNWATVPVEYYPIRDGEHGGTLIWVNRAELYVQFKLTFTAGENDAAPLFRRLTLYFNDTSQGPSDQAAAQAHSLDIGHVPLTCPVKPPVIPRSVWGCPPGQTSPRWPPVYEPVTHIVVNHTATPNNADDWAKVVRSIWNYHANVLGWGDIGYQYLIDPLGNIYEGRAGGDDVIGAFDGFNRGAMGIGYIGCYGNCDYLGLSNAEPPPALLEAGNELIAWKAGQKEIDPFGSGQYCEQTLPNIVTRSEVTCRGGSLSPGELLAARLPDIRAAVEEKIADCQVPAPSPSPTPTSTLTPTITSTPTVTPTLTPTPTSTPIISGSTVRVAPDFIRIASGETGNNAVEVANITDLFGVELSLNYDPTIVEVVDVDLDTPGTQVALGSVFSGVDSFVVENEATNGVINFSATRRSPAPVFTGTGSLIDITWRGLSAGQTALTLAEVKLADPNGNPLAATVLDGEIEVISGVVVIILGQVELQGGHDNSGVTVALADQQVQTDADGRFELGVVEGSYTLTMRAPGHLSAMTELEVSPSLATVDVGRIILLGGDVTEDDKINIFDLAFIGSRFGQDDVSADINDDGGVNIFDLVMAAVNYGQSGPISIGLEPQTQARLE